MSAKKKTWHAPSQDCWHHSVFTKGVPAHRQIPLTTFSNWVTKQGHQNHPDGLGKKLYNPHCSSVRQFQGFQLRTRSGHFLVCTAEFPEPDRLLMGAIVETFPGAHLRVFKHDKLRVGAILDLSLVHAHIVNRVCINLEWCLARVSSL